VTLTFTPGDRVRLTAAIDGDANDVSWRWVPPEGSSAPASTTNVLEWTTGANDAGVYDVEVVSPTASDSPSYGAFSLNLASAFDPDAAVYIAAVEAADGQALEDGVREAINTLVVELKATAGLWGSLDIFAPLAGPRTVAGCVVPLRGATPFSGTNVTSGDYSRAGGFRSKTGMRIAISAEGYDPYPSTGQMSIFAQTTERVLPGSGWAAGLISQEQWPDQRTGITLSIDNLLGLFAMRSVDADSPTIAIPAVLPDVAFYSVVRIDATTIRLRAGQPQAPSTRNSPFSPVVAGLGPIALFAEGPNMGARAMCAGSGTSFLDTIQGDALETACRNYHFALATAIPATAQVKTASDLAAARARTPNGQFIADDLSTPDVNEAWTDGRGPS
jgi:hypothetical protein